MGFIRVWVEIMNAELVTVDGKLYVKSHLDCHKDDPLKEVLRGYESFSGMYWFVTENLPADEAFGFVQGTWDSEWGYICWRSIRQQLGNRVWPIKKCDLPHAGKRGD